MGLPNQVKVAQGSRPKAPSGIAGGRAELFFFFLLFIFETTKISLGPTKMENFRH